jgi:hypothetical protein
MLKGKIIGAAIAGALIAMAAGASAGPVAAPGPTAVAQSSRPPVEKVYYWHGRYYPYYWHGHYYPYYWGGRYYNYRWRGGYYNYYWHGRYYNHRGWYHGGWRYW